MTSFSVDEANRTLPLVRLVVEDIVETHAELERLKENYRAQRLAEGLGPEEMPAADSDLYKMDETLMVKMLKLQSYIKEIEEIGASVGAVEEGEVDFPSELDGREIQLSWRRGEPVVGHWHDPDEAGVRKPLPAGVV